MRAISGKYQAKLYFIKAAIKNFLWYQIRAWQALRGKEMIIDSRPVTSRGGYKYLQLEISPKPLSKTNVIS